MAATETTTYRCYATMLEETQEQWRADQERMLEQRRVNQERLQKIEEQRIASEERNRNVMQILFRALCTGQVPSVPYTSADCFFT